MHNGIRHGSKDNPVIFISKRMDGKRRMCSWWEDNKFHAQLYSRWLWGKWFGNIPNGYIIHHKDGVLLNDWIENYELLKNSEHTRLHFDKVYEYNIWKHFLLQHNNMDCDYKTKRRWLSVGTFSMTNGEKLNFILQQYNIKSCDLSARANLDETLISRIRSGERNPGGNFLRKLFIFLDKFDRQAKV